ncbi:MAG: phospholipid/cholesterol/gamma-HCH transport system substrate-binding protein [Thermoleophilaceae bacterium]|nr:phospholipid/cholesterol/gamma-HCH transport system substrate-binding protein [Thermoleophilaceae bacterium]
MTAAFQSSSQLVKGNLVEIGGSPVGVVDAISLAPNGEAHVGLKITDGEFTPLHQGTTAIIRQASLSGIANRYVDLNLPTGPDSDNPDLPDGGSIGTIKTTTPVDLDEVFDTLDSSTRVAIQDFISNSELMLHGKAKAANRGLVYLNPALSTTRRLLEEVNRDTPVLQGFVSDSAKLVTTLAERRDDVAALIGNLNSTARALGDQKTALAQSISGLPGFMRSADTTFVNLRSTLNKLDPVVNASKPVVSKSGSGNDLQELLPELRRFTANAKPTVRNLDAVVQRPGSDNDLVEATKSFVPLENIALQRQTRTVAPGGRKFTVNDGHPVDGAFPETAKALKDTAPIIAFGRPYTPALFGWFDDFSTPTAGTDAVSGTSRAHTYLNATSAAGGVPLTLNNLGLSFGPLDPLIQPILSPVLELAGLIQPGSQLVPNRQDILSAGVLEDRQYHRCPGSADPVAPDKSNLLTPAEQKKMDCLEADRAVGPVP